MDVARIAYLATHCAPPEAGENACAACGVQTATVVPVTTTVSDTFTGYDNWAFPRGRHVCQRCHWVYTTPALRAGTLLITSYPPAFTTPARAEAATLLAAGGLPLHRALVVPFRPGRKHLLPLAQWGHLATDYGTVRWRATDARRLNVIQQLRADGFGSTQLLQPAPAYRPLTAIPRARWPDVFQLWQELDPWRTPNNPWLTAAIHLTVAKGTS